MPPPGFVWRDGVRLAAAGCSRAAGVNFSLIPFLLFLLGRLSLLFASQYCCRYIFELHTLRDNHSTCRSFCCYLVVARLALLVAHPFGSCCCPPSPRYRPIDSCYLHRLALVVAARLGLITIGFCHRPFSFCCHPFGTSHLARLASVSQPGWQPYSLLGQTIYNTLSFSSLRE